MTRARITGVGHYLPSRIVTNQDIEKFVDTTDEWIKTRTGISERRIASDEIDTSDMGYYASKEAMESGKIAPEEIDMIIVATCTPDKHFPSVACMIQEKLGAKNASCFDISAACSGFIYALSIAKTFIETKTYKNILVVGTDKLSKLIDWSDRNTCVLFGDGAGAVLLSPTEKSTGILNIELGADGTGGKYLHSEGEKIIMNGSEVFKFAVRKMGDSAVHCLEKAGFKKEDLALLIPHQANIRIMESARTRLGLSPDKMSVTVDKFGNTSAASIPLSLYHEVKLNKINNDDLLIVVGFGGGLTWGSALIRWDMN